MAIQVSGTEVISNARALTNVASIDATTAASFAAGGVGGSTTLLQDVTFSSSVATISISMPVGYKKYIVDFKPFSLDPSYAAYDQLLLRYLDSSLNPISSIIYDYGIRFNSSLTSSGNVAKTSIPIAIGNINTLAANSLAMLSFEFINVRGTSRSSFTILAGSQWPAVYNQSSSSGWGATITSQDFGGVYLYWSGTQRWGAGGGAGYTVWGVK